MVARCLRLRLPEHVGVLPFHVFMVVSTQRKLKSCMYVFEAAKLGQHMSASRHEPLWMGDSHQTAIYVAQKHDQTNIIQYTYSFGARRLRAESLFGHASPIAGRVLLRFRKCPRPKRNFTRATVIVQKTSKPHLNQCKQQQYPK